MKPIHTVRLIVGGHCLDLRGTQAAVTALLEDLRFEPPVLLLWWETAERPARIHSVAGYSAVLLE